MKKSALFIFNILFSLACFSSDVQVNNEQKLKQNVTSTSQLMRNDTIISSNDTCADAITHGLPPHTVKIGLTLPIKTA